MTAAPYRDGAGLPVHLGRELGRGGQGTVYEVTGRPGAVAKIYLQKPEHETVEKLSALTLASQPLLLDISAWPQSTLRDPSGQVHGFVMPLVDESEYLELHNLYRITSRRQHFPSADWRFLVRVARNVARAFKALHHHGHLMGDVSSRNVLASKTATVRFIDTDSFQIRVGGRVYPCPVGTAEFTPPELQGKRFGGLVRTAEHDLFGLALLVFHLLFDGRHPYAGVHDNGAMPSPAEAIAADKFAYSLQHRHGVRPPPFTITLDGVHPGLRDLFERAFSPRHQGRPTAGEWEQTLAELERNITTCGKNAAHKHDRRLPCPWCTVLPANAQAATAKSGIPAGAKRIDVEGELNRIWAGLQAIPVPPAPAAIVLSTPPTPLPLPAMPALAAPPPEPSLAPLPPRTPVTPPQAFSKSAVVWGIAATLLCLSSLVQGGWLAAVFFAVVAVYNFQRNSPEKVRARQQKQLAERTVRHERERQEAEARRVQEFQQLSALREKAIGQNKEHQKQTYLKLLSQALLEQQLEANALRKKVANAYARQAAESAQGKHQAAVKRLQTLREELRSLDRQEQVELQRTLERHRQPMLEQHLARFPIKPGDVQGIGSSIIANLNARGVYTAKDITPDVHYIKGVGPKKQMDLLAWRDTLEQFFQFDPARVPPSAFDAVRVQFDQQRVTRLKQLEDEVAQLRRDVATWQQAEAAVEAELRDLKFRLAQREKTIEVIQTGALHLG
ncbi:protein kinase domain-containing protein [Deinococcus apachensis]|uniref:protein kinase domain-containing protein n=1 Tax=Deinococcus apachensis TaxID=309886 RepID=UPI00037F85FD|nr:hypothetical protein [Deinococcus apachensis]